MINPKAAYRSPTLTPPSPMSIAKRTLEIAGTEDVSISKRRRATSKSQSTNDVVKIESQEAIHQVALLLHAPKQRYQLVDKHEIPSLKNDREMLVKVQAIGLNPIDWKAPDFGFGLPTLPCVSGRDLAGKVVSTHESNSRFKTDDIVLGISTDYRDSRKSAYQEFAVVSDFNACKIPSRLTATEVAPLGVAFVAAVLALGICIGVDFSQAESNVAGPDLLKIIRSLPTEALAQDIRTECFEGINIEERPQPGDWIAIWGGSSATGCCAIQLAKLAGLKVVCVLDVERNGDRILKHGADLLIDRENEARAVKILRGVTKGKLRFGLDTRGKESAGLLAEAMQKPGNDLRPAHVVGLTGLPKERLDGITYHSVPIKAFHEAEAVGESMMIWLEKMLHEGVLATPDIEVAEGGLNGINNALDRLRNGSVSGPRLVTFWKSKNSFLTAVVALGAIRVPHFQQIDNVYESGFDADNKDAMEFPLWKLPPTIRAEIYNKVVEDIGKGLLYEPRKYAWAQSDINWCHRDHLSYFSAEEMFFHVYHPCHWLILNGRGHFRTANSKHRGVCWQLVPRHLLVSETEGKNMLNLASALSGEDLAAFKSVFFDTKVLDICLSEGVYMRNWFQQQRPSDILCIQHLSITDPRLRSKHIQDDICTISRRLRPKILAISLQISWRLLDDIKSDNPKYGWLFRCIRNMKVTELFKIELRIEEWLDIQLKADSDEWKDKLGDIKSREPIRKAHEKRLRGMLLPDSLRPENGVFVEDEPFDLWKLFTEVEEIQDMQEAYLWKRRHTVETEHSL